MKAHPPAALAFALLALAACANNDPMPAATPASATAAPVSNDPLGTSMMTPQSPNSLPPGAAVNAPLTPDTGAVSTTPVAPTTRRAPRR